MAHAVRTAISLPKEDFKILEAIRKKLDKSRSQVFLEALRAWFHRLKTEDLERRYVEGYRKKPEDPAELEAFYKAGLASFPKERW